MPVLLLKDLRSAVADGIRDYHKLYLPAHKDQGAYEPQCPDSQDFMMHIAEATFLVDKSLIMTEFIGSWKPLEELFSTENMSVKPGSSLKRELNEEDSPRKRVWISDVDTPTHLKSLIARPRRFGKTFNLSMMYEFLRTADTPSNERKRKLIFKQMEIWKTFPQFCELHFAKHPVIFVSFKACCRINFVMLW